MNDEGWTPLLLASWRYSGIDALDYLIEQGADVNVKGKMGFTPLHCAAQNHSNPEVLNFLIIRGANINARDDEGKTPFDLAGTPEKKTILSNVSEKTDGQADFESTRKPTLIGCCGLLRQRTIPTPKCRNTLSTMLRMSTQMKTTPAGCRLTWQGKLVILR